MIKNVEIEMYGYKWLIEIDQYSSDEFDFDINKTVLTSNGYALDMYDLVDDNSRIEEFVNHFVAIKLKQEALNNV